MSSPLAGPSSSTTAAVDFLDAGAFLGTATFFLGEGAEAFDAFLGVIGAGFLIGVAFAVGTVAVVDVFVDVLIAAGFFGDSVGLDGILAALMTGVFISMNKLLASLERFFLGVVEVEEVTLFDRAERVLNGGVDGGAFSDWDALFLADLVAVTAADLADFMGARSSEESLASGELSMMVRFRGGILLCDPELIGQFGEI